MSAEFLRKTMLLSLIAAVSLTTGVVLYRTNHPPPPTIKQNLDLIGQPAPEIVLTDLAGEPFTLSDWREHTVLINFWATWCPPCRVEVPVLIDAQQRYSSRGLKIVGVAIDELPALRRFQQQTAINYPVLPSTFRLMEQFGNLLGTMPYNVLLDRQGVVVGQYFQPLTHETLDKILSDFLPPESRSNSD